MINNLFINGKIKLYLLFILTVLNISMAYSTEPWVLYKNKSGIKVYKKNTHTGLVKLKAQMTLKAKVSDFVFLLEDTENASQWLDGVISVSVLKRLSEVENIVYSVFNAPWPVKNRDMLTYSIYQYYDDGSLLIKIKTAPPSLTDGFDKTGDNIAITGVVASWRLTPKKGGMLEITYMAYADPGGSLPNWLINQIALSGAFNTFKNLFKALKSTP